MPQSWPLAWRWPPATCWPRSPPPIRSRPDFSIRQTPRVRGSGGTGWTATSRRTASQRDLEWLHRVGIGGVTLFDAALGGKQVVDKRLVYMTPEWQDAIRYAVQTADSLGLDVTIATSAGWSETGGPWVKPADAMKKLVWSDTIVQGGTHAHRSAAAPADRERALSAGGADSGPVHRARADEGHVLRRRESRRISAAGCGVAAEAGEGLDGKRADRRRGPRGRHHRGDSQAPAAVGRLAGLGPVRLRAAHHRSRRHRRPRRASPRLLRHDAAGASRSERGRDHLQAGRHGRRGRVQPEHDRDRSRHRAHVPRRLRAAHPDGPAAGAQRHGARRRVSGAAIQRGRCGGRCRLSGVRTGPADRARRQPVRREGGIRDGTGLLRGGHARDRSGDGRRPRRCRRSHVEDAIGRHARLDATRWPLADHPARILADGTPERAGAGGGVRLRGGQAQSRSRPRLHEHLPVLVSRRCWAPRSSARVECRRR